MLSVEDFAMSESNPKSPRNTPFDLVGVGVPISRNVQDSQSDPEILPDVASPKPATLGTRYSSRMRQPPRGLADYVTTPRSMAAKRKAERRAKQSHDQKQIRLGHQASYQSKYRALQTPEQLAIRLGKQAVFQSEYRIAETPEQKAALAEAKAHHRAQETSEQLAIRLGKQAEYRVAETPEQKAGLAEAKAHHRAQETPEQLAIRLGKQAEYRVAETPEQKAAHAVAEAQRRAQETPEQKAAHAAAKAHRRAQETPEQTTQRQKTDRVSHRTRSATRRQRANQDMEAFFATHPEIPARTRGDYARAEEMQYELVRKEVARAARQRRREERLQQPEVVAEQTRVGGPLCDINAHLNYVTGTGTDPNLHSDIAHLLDEVAQCTKPDLVDQWAQAVKLEERLKERMFDTAPCACCGELKPVSSMQLEISENHHPNILELLVSEITPEIRRPTRVALSTGQREYAIHESYQGQPHVSVCNQCYKCLAGDDPRVPQLCIKTVDIGPWPTIILDGISTPLKEPTLIERIVISPVVTTKYVTTGYDVDRAKNRPAGHLTGHITAFPSASPGEVDEALQRFFPKSIQSLTDVQQIVLVTAGNAAEARGKAKHMAGMYVSGFWVKHWCEHMQQTYEEYGIQDEMVSRNDLVSARNCYQNCYTQNYYPNLNLNPNLNLRTRFRIIRLLNDLVSTRNCYKNCYTRNC